MRRAKSKINQLRQERERLLSVARNLVTIEPRAELQDIYERLLLIAGRLEQLELYLFN